MEQIQLKYPNLHIVKKAFAIVALLIFGKLLTAQVLQPCGTGLPSRVVASYATGNEYFALVEDLSTPKTNDYTMARWNGVFWKYYPGLETPAPMLMSDGQYNFHSVAFFNNTMYVGAFISNSTKDPDVPISHLYKWDDSKASWVSETGVVETKNDGIIAMTVFDNKLIVAGRFSNTVNGKTVQSIASFDGTNWNYLGDNQNAQGVDGIIRSLIVVGNRLYIGGDFKKFAGSLTGNIAYYTASNGGWGGVGSPYPGEVSDLAYFDNQLVAIGRDSFGKQQVRIFNSSWSKPLVFDSFDIATVNTIAGNNNYLLLGGDFIKDGNHSSLVKYYNGQFSFTSNRIQGPFTLGQRGNSAFVWGNFKENNTGLKYFSALEESTGNLWGDLYYDVNGNCIKDLGEYGISNQVLRIVKNDKTATFFAVTDSLGHFSMALPSGDYSINHMLPRHMYAVCSGNFATNITAGKYSSVSLGEYMDPTIKDLEVTLTPVYPAIVNPGDKVKFLLKIVNHGANSLTGPTVHVQHANQLTGFSSLPAADNYDIFNTEATYSLVDFKPFETRFVEMSLTLPENATPSDKYLIQVKTGSLFTTNDKFSADNFDSLRLQIGKRSHVTNSVSKTSSKGDSLDFRSTSWSYRVDFNNTSSKTVNKAVVIDTLSSVLPLQRLLLTSFYPLNAKYYIQGGNTLVVCFNPANLSPNELNSQTSFGWVEYQVDLYQKLPLNSTIDNIATVDFDGIWSSRSNNCQVQMIDPFASVKDIKGNIRQIRPNPASTTILVKWLPLEVNQNWQLFDAIGQIVMQGKCNINESEINVAGLPTGVYFLKTSLGVSRISVAR